MHLFFSTEPAPCPYLADRLERRLVTVARGAANPTACTIACCAPAFAGRKAMPIDRAAPAATPAYPFAWRYALRFPAAVAPHFAGQRRPGGQRAQGGRDSGAVRAVSPLPRAPSRGEQGMADMTWAEFRGMINDSPVDTRVVEWRRADGSLIAASLTDRSASGFSGVYKFFDPEEARRLARHHDHSLARAARGRARAGVCLPGLLDRRQCDHGLQVALPSSGTADASRLASHAGPIPSAAAVAQEAGGWVPGMAKTSLCEDGGHPYSARSVAATVQTDLIVHALDVHQ